MSDSTAMGFGRFMALAVSPFQRLGAAWPRLKGPSIRFAPLLVISLVSVGIYLKMLLYAGYISWGNFGTPLGLTFSHSFFPNAITFSFYSSFGVPVTSPAIGIADSVYDPILLLLGGGWNGDLAMKLFILLSTIFFASSFYKLASEISSSRVSRTVATLFILLNPVNLDFVQQGLFQSFFWQGFYFLGLAFIPGAVRSHGIGRIRSCFFSAVCIALTIGQPELFYLGLPLYFVFVFYFGLVAKSEYTVSSLVNFLKTSVTSLILITLLCMPLILTSIYSAYNLSPGSSLANPLSDYILYSSNVWDLLAMNANPAFPVQGLISNVGVSAIWIISIDVVTFSILAGGYLFREGRLLFLTLIVVIAALLGAGAASPFSSFDIYLYENFPGFQLLNDALYWAWIVIVPIYGIMLVILIDRVRPLLAVEPITPRGEKPPARRSFSPTGWRAQSVWLCAFAACFLLVLALFIPLAVQPYYTSNGIHPNDLPDDYGTLVSQLTALVGSSGYGVAYFPPDPGIFFGNSGGGSVNPLLLNPYVRSATPIASGNVPTPSGYYFTWVYDEFYSNKTTEIAELMGVMGIKYFVTLDDVDGKGTTYTQMMLYQHNVSLIYTSPQYSIFENTLPVNVAMSAGDLVVLSSDYSAIEAAATDGLDISELPMAFLSDLNSSNFGFFLNRTSTLVLQGEQDLTSLAMASFINGSDSMEAVNGVSNFAYSLSAGWVRSSALYVYPQEIPNESIEAVPFAFALTEAQVPLSIDFTLPSTGSYTLWANLFNSPYPNSTIQLRVGNYSDTIATTSAGSPGGFTWVGLPFSSNTRRVVVDATPYGLNGIDRFVILRTGAVSQEVSSLSTYIADHRVNVLYYGNSSSSPGHSTLVGAINNETRNAVPFSLSAGPNSYQIDGEIGNMTLVRLNYFAGMIPSSAQIDVIPLLGGMSYLIVSSHPQSQVVFTSVDYGPFLEGAAICLATIFVCLGLLLGRRPRARTLGPQTVMGSQPGTRSATDAQVDAVGPSQ